LAVKLGLDVSCGLGLKDSSVELRLSTSGVLRLNDLAFGLGLNALTVGHGHDISSGLGLEALAVELGFCTLGLLRLNISVVGLRTRPQ